MGKCFDLIQKNVEQRIGLKELGFINKKGIYNRVTESGITQVIYFWGYDRFGEHRLQMLYGIRVSEIANENFNIIDDYNSNVVFDNINVGGDCRSDDIAHQDYYKVTDKNSFEIIDDICKVIKEKVLPMLTDLETRDKIINNINKYYPDKLDQLRRLFFIFGGKGDKDTAKKLMDEYFAEVVYRFENGDMYVKNGISNVYNFVKMNSLNIEPKIIEKYNSLITKFLEERNLKKFIKESLLN